MKKNKGITLIALIISIIVLLILALVTIKAIQGEDDLFYYAQKAKFQTQVTQIIETLRIKRANVYLDNEGRYTTLINDNEFKLLKDITSEDDAYLNLSDEFIRMYGSNLGIGKIKNDTEKIYYSGESTLSEKEKAWLTEIKVSEWSLSNKTAGILRRPRVEDETQEPNTIIIAQMQMDSEEEITREEILLNTAFGGLSSEEVKEMMKSQAQEYEMSEEELWEAYGYELVGVLGVASYEDLIDKINEVTDIPTIPLVTREWVRNCGATKVEFKIGLPQDTSNARDFTMEHNETILGYVSGDTLYIASDSPIKPFSLGDYAMDEFFKDLIPVETESIKFNNAFDTSEVTNMSYMFSGCENLTSLDLSGINTANVTNMSHMFYECTKLTSLDLSSFDTSKVTTMGYMFSNDTNLTTINLSSFNTEKVERMECMFSGCQKLASLNLLHFDTNKVTDMWGMFRDCNTLKVLDISSFELTSGPALESIFNGCSSMEHIYVNERWTDGGISGIYGNCPVTPEVKED